MQTMQLVVAAVLAIPWIRFNGNKKKKIPMAA